MSVFACGFGKLEKEGGRDMGCRGKHKREERAMKKDLSGFSLLFFKGIDGIVLLITDHYCYHHFHIE